jgi:hypothetical protein
MNPLNYRSVISSSHRDSHGFVMTKEALEKMVLGINSDKRVRLGVDHRRDFPPKGRLENATLLEKDGFFYVEADFRSYENSAKVDWDETLMVEFFETPFTFIEIDDDIPESYSIFIDPQNFTSFEAAERFANELMSKKEIDLSVDFMGRKSAIPDPEIVFKLAGSALFYHILKPVAKKIGEKIADEIADKAFEELKKLTKVISTTLKNAFTNLIPKNRPVTTVFELPGKPHIELVARTRDQKVVLKGLTEKRLAKIKDQIEYLNNHVKIAKVQFILSPKGNWQFNYLLTEDGKSIGKKEAFAKRDKKLELMPKKNRK